MNKIRANANVLFCRVSKYLNLKVWITLAYPQVSSVFTSKNMILLHQKSDLFL